MSCNNCTTNKDNGQTTARGCKNNGTCGTSGCNKFSVYDWLSDVSTSLGEKKFDGVEVNFKNGRKLFYRNTDRLPIQMGDKVVVEADKGYDLGTISLTGELVRVQMQKKRVPIASNLPKIYRKANQEELNLLQEYRDKEYHLQKRTRELAIDLGLKMKLSDVEFQADGTKATFYYTADERVDFRQLIKAMGSEFGIRVEMKQISERQEASRLGGIGSCGRELCCSQWLSDLRGVKVSTAAARYQQLSLNMEKLAGQCGKLKCCLNFELDVYSDALKDFPKTDTQIQTEAGVAVCQKIDIFKRLMWFSYKENHSKGLHKLSVEQVKKMIKINQNGQKVESIEQYSQALEEKTFDVSQTSTMEFDSITRFDKPKAKKSKNKKKKPENQPKPQNVAEASAKKKAPKKNKNKKPLPKKNSNDSSQN